MQDRIKEFRRVPASELTANPKNWRTHPPEQQAALKAMLDEVGIADAVIARETPDGLVLIDGHLRKDTLPDTQIPTLVLDVTEAEADKLLLTIDPLAAMAGHDDAQLSALLAGFETDNESLKDLLGDLEDKIEIADDSDGELEDVEPLLDRADELLKQWKVQRGQVWRIGEHRLMCGDCRSMEDARTLIGTERINVAFTSPPYASQRKYDEQSEFKPIPPDDYVEWFASVQAVVREYLADDGSWFVNIKPCADGLDTSLYVLDLVCAHVREWRWHFATEFCWERNGPPMKVTRRFKNQFEPVYHFALNDWKFRPEDVRHSSEFVPKAKGVGAGDTKASTRQGTGVCAVGDNEVLPGMAYPGNRLPQFASKAIGHPAAFPLGLPTFFIKAFSDEGDNVYDPFLGSGTSMLAAERLGRRCFGMEISPRYCAVILQRMSDAGCTCEQEKERSVAEAT